MPVRKEAAIRPISKLEKVVGKKRVGATLLLEAKLGAGSSASPATEQALASERSRLEEMGVCGSSQPDTVAEPVPKTELEDGWDTDESTGARSVASSTIGSLPYVGDVGRERMAPLMSSKVGAASGSFTPTPKKKVGFVVGP